MPHCPIAALGYSSCRLSSSSTKLAFFAVITQTATHYQPVHPHTYHTVRVHNTSDVL